MGGNSNSLLSLVSLGDAVAGGNAAKSDITFKQNEQILSRASNELQLVEAELESQKRLRKVLAAQGNLFAATGINASKGSAARLSDAAFGETGAELDKIKSKRNLARLNDDNIQSSLSLKRRQAQAKANREALTALIKFGASF